MVNVVTHQCCDVMSLRHGSPRIRIDEDFSNHSGRIMTGYMAGEFNLPFWAESPDQRFSLAWFERNAVGFVGHVHASHLLHLLFVLGLFPCISDDEFVSQLPFVSHDEAYGFPRPNIQPGLVQADVQSGDLDGTINLSGLARMTESGSLCQCGYREGKQQQ